MKNERRIDDGKIFEYLKEKVIFYDDLKIKYFISYSEANNNKKRNSNDRTRDELEVIFDELSKIALYFVK